ncbi:hypothetical protein Tco_1147987, partial [Tanacetum coccineum]
MVNLGCPRDLLGSKWTPPTDVATDVAADLAWVYMPCGTTHVVISYIEREILIYYYSTSRHRLDQVFDVAAGESVIRYCRRNLGDPSLLLNFEDIDMNPNNVQGPLPAGPNIPDQDLRPMEELLQAPTDGVRDAIVVPLVLAS